MKKPVVLSAATVLATLAVALVWTQLRDERTRGAELFERVAVLESAPPPALPPAVADVIPQSVETPANKPVIDAPSAVPARAAAAPAPAEAEPEPAPLMQAMMEAMQAPEARDASRSMMRAMLQQMYPDLAAELGLSADEANRFLDLLGGMEDDAMEDAMALVEGSPPGSAAREALLRRMEEKQRAQEAQQSAMLGNKYPQWQNYQHMATARNEINDLRTVLSTSDNPLTDAQAQQLLPVIAEEQRRIERQERDWMTSPAAVQAPNLMQASTTHALEAQQGLVELVSRQLTAAQSQLYRNKKEQELAMLRAMMGMFGGGGGQSPGMPGGVQP